MAFRHLIVIIFLGALVACDFTAEVSRELKQEPYFDLPDLVNQQLAHLDSLRPSVEITAKIGDQSEVEEIQKDSAAWAETLKLFSKADINRPVLQGSYQVKDSTDQKQGWNIRIYQAKQPEKVEIPYLAVYYQDSLNDVRKVEAVFREDNILYHTERKMEMVLRPTRLGPLLTEYRSQGKQKMIFRDSVNYLLTATVRYSQPESI